MPDADAIRMRDIPAGSEADPKKVIENFYAALVSGDPDEMRGVVDSDVIVDYYGPDGYLPWCGTWLGFDGFIDFLSTVGDYLDIVSVTTEKAVGDKEHVVTVVEGHWRMRDTGIEVVAKSSNIFTIRGGRILRYEVIADTASLGAAFRGTLGM